MSKGKTSEPTARLIEIGWLVSDHLQAADYQAIDQARQRMLALLQEQFKEFDWQMPLVRWSTPAQTDWSHAASLLYEGAYERDVRHWDYALIVTAADLRCYYKPYALAMPSPSLLLSFPLPG